MSEKTGRTLLVILLGIAVIAFVMPYCTIGGGDVGKVLDFFSGLAGQGSVKTSWSALGFIAATLGITDNAAINRALREAGSDGSSVEVLIAFTYLIALLGCVINLIIVATRKERKNAPVIVLHIISFMGFQAFRILYSIGMGQIRQDARDELGILGDYFTDAVDSLVKYGSGYYLFTVMAIIIFIVLIVDMNAAKNDVAVSTGQASVDYIQPQPEYEDFSNAKTEPLYFAMKTGTIRVLSGKYAGAEIPIHDGETVTIGRNPQLCNLIFEASTVSGEHCVIRFAANEEVFYVMDKSMNGTFRENNVTRDAQRIDKGTWVKMAPGTVIVVGQNGDRVELQCY